MKESSIRFKTIQFINGTGYLYKEQIEILKHIICQELKIEENKANFDIINDAIKTYFKLKQ